jgi:hypothetical protein
VFILLEKSSPSRRIFIGSHSLLPLWSPNPVLQERIVAEPQGDQLGKTIVEAVTELVKSRTFREVARIGPPSMKKTRVTTALQVQEIRPELDNEKQGGTTTTEGRRTGGRDE